MTSVPRQRLTLLFILKLGAAALVWLIYSYHYSGVADFFTYFSDSNIAIHNLTSNGKANFSGAWAGSFDGSFLSGSKTMIVVNAILQIFSFGNFYVHAVFFTFFSFVGLVALLKALLNHFPEKKMALIVMIFFLPDALFWGSAPLKESLLIGLTGLLVYCTDFGLKKDYKKEGILFSCLLLSGLLFTAMYVLFALLPVLLINFIITKTSRRGSLLKYMSGLLIFLFIFLLSGKISPDTDILRIISDKRAKAISEARGGVFLQDDKRFICVDYDKRNSILIPVSDSIYTIREGSSFLSWPLENMDDTMYVTNSKDTSMFRMLYFVTPAHSVIAMAKLSKEPYEFIKGIPSAFITSLIHPSIFEIDSWLHLFAAVENLWILLILILVIFFFDKAVVKEKEIILFCLIFSAILMVIVGLTTPALGSLLRYRTPGLLFFITALTLMIDFKKIKKKFIEKKST